MQLAQELIERLEGVHLNIASIHKEGLETTIILHEELEKAESIRTLRSLDYLELLYTEIGNAQYQRCDLSLPEEKLQEFSKILRGEPQYVVLEPFQHHEQVNICVCADKEILKEKNSFYKKKVYLLNQK